MIRLGRSPSTPESRMIGGVVGALVGIGILCWAAWSLWEAHRTRSWPSTEGQIVESRMETYRTSKGRTRTRARVAYQYNVDGRTYSSTRWNTCDSPPDSAVGENPPGSAVTVFYDPAEPTAAVLVPGASSTPYLMLLAGLAFLAISWWTVAEGATAAGLGAQVNTGRLYRTSRVEFNPDGFLK